VNLVLTERNALDGPELGVELASALRKLYPADFKIDRMIELLVNQSAFDGLLSGKDPRRIAQDWQGDLDRFEGSQKEVLNLLIPDVKKLKWSPPSGHP